MPFVGLSGRRKSQKINSFKKRGILFSPRFFSMTGISMLCGEIAPSRKRVTRTRLKRHNFGIFWLVIFARRQPYCIFRAKICSKFYLFQVVEFWESGFLVAQGKNAGNPVGLPSILTQRKRKSASQNRGSDYSLSARRSYRRTLKQLASFTSWGAREKKHMNIYLKTIVLTSSFFTRYIGT